jgi:hypothetical protein
MIRSLITPSIVFAAALAVGCGGGDPGPSPSSDANAPTPPAAVAPTPGAAVAPPASHGLNDFEWGLLGDTVTAIRAGISPVSTEALGICTTDDGRTCAAFVGTETGPLPPGDYLFYAELEVPDAGPTGTWKVTFETSCTVTAAPGSSSSANTQSKEYTVNHSGSEHGYRLRLRTFTSPLPGGTRSCDWTLTSTAPEGGPAWSGSWVVPAEEK